MTHPVQSIDPWEESGFFAGAPAAFVDRVRPHVRESAYRAQQAIFNEGDRASSLYLLKSGHVELTYTLPTRPDATVRITLVNPGDVFGWSALVGASHLTARALALEDSEVFEISAQELRAAMDAVPVFGYRVMDRLASLIASRLRDTRVQLQWLNTF